MSGGGAWQTPEEDASYYANVSPSRGLARKARTWGRHVKRGGAAVSLCLGVPRALPGPDSPF